jgi:hypothetical protein
VRIAITSARIATAPYEVRRLHDGADLELGSSLRGGSDMVRLSLCSLIGSGWRIFETAGRNVIETVKEIQLPV